MGTKALYTDPRFGPHKIPTDGTPRSLPFCHLVAGRCDYRGHVEKMVQTHKVKEAGPLI